MLLMRATSDQDRRAATHPVEHARTTVGGGRGGTARAGWVSATRSWVSACSRRRGASPAVHRSPPRCLHRDHHHHLGRDDCQPGTDGSAASAVTLLACIVLACVFGYHAAPALSRWMAGIRLPVFPSATSRWVFEARPDLPTTVVKTQGAPVHPGGTGVGPRCAAAGRTRPVVPDRIAGGHRHPGGGVRDRPVSTRTPRALVTADPGRIHRRFLLLRGPLLRGPLAGHHLAVTAVITVAAVVTRYVRC